MSLITPKYLTKELAEKAIRVGLMAVTSSQSHINNLLERSKCSIVILVPAMEDARAEDYPNWPNYPLSAHCLCEKHIGIDWERPYNEIAMCEALQLWTDRNDGLRSIVPHLLFSGDTPYWGGVKREGIVVTCAGLQPYFNRLISGIIVDTLIALAQHAFENDAERKSSASFLS